MHTTFSIPYSDRWVEARIGIALALGLEHAFSIPYSDRWVEASSTFEPSTAIGPVLSVSPTRIVGLRRCKKPRIQATLPPTFSIPYSDRWVEAMTYRVRTVSVGTAFQYPLLGSLG